MADVNVYEHANFEGRLNQAAVKMPTKQRLQILTTAGSARTDDSDGPPDAAVVPPTSWQHPAEQFLQALENPWYHLAFNLMAEMHYSHEDFFRSLGFVPALMPVTCGSVSSPMGLGSDSLPVKIELFGNETYLADSMQFQLEYLLRLANKGVYYLMPTFRGEEHDERHLNQFFHIEAEQRGDLESVMKTVEGLVMHCTERVLSRHAQDIRRVTGTLEHLELLLRQKSFPQVTARDAMEMLGESPSFYQVLDGKRIGISRVGERELMNRFGGCVWLTHLPALGVPFYQANAPDPEEALCADLLMGIGEIAGCGERNVTEVDTRAALIRRGVDPTEYDWYLRMKSTYPIQTAGFGLGVERFLLWVLKHNDIRDVHLMPRLKGVCSTP